MRRPNHRRRIQIARMQNQISRQATFSKRRFGLFKKASELSTLCGADIAIVVYCPSNKLYSFWHPFVESIVERFLEEDLTPGTNDPNPIIIAQQNANVDEINRKLNTLEKEFAKEKRRGQTLQALRTEPSHEKLIFSGLKSLCEALEAADEEVYRVVSKLLEADEIFLYQTIGSVFAPLIVRESTLFDSDEGSSQSSEYILLALFKVQ
ncbi:agamous-like MADS-box protein AGL62 [Solanum pennellii]|uniref:Agamous-like MADS-box protein AGL62 n=1 Tax=Solanum pennellii TaxID=28526 RepID=A0ABM1H3Z4_SOLPN|nr:agamous-like MADS-box protein AGL62 [Solanum pennellii]